MSTKDALRQLVKQRLDAAAEEIFGLFEKTIADYEKKLSRFKKKKRQHKVQDAANSCQDQLHTPDAQQLSVIKEVPHEWSSSPDQQNPELVHIKEEQEEVLTSQEGEQLRGLKQEEKEEEEEEEDISRFSLSAVPVKSEEKQKSDGEDCGGKVSDSFETEVDIDEDDHDKWQESLTDSGPETEDSDTDDDDDDNWPKSLADFGAGGKDGEGGGKDSGAPESGVSGDVGFNTPKTSFSYSESLFKQSLQRHVACHSGKMFPSCLFGVNQNADSQIRVHTGDKVFGCDVCGQRFNRRTNLRAHMRVHTGEKPFQCHDCGKRFRHPYNFRRHMRVHSGEKPFGCDVCSKRFTEQGILISHMNVHTGEKPFSCDICGRTFVKKSYLKTHMMVHSGEKPFGCLICGRKFTRKGDLKRHMLVHMKCATNEAAPLGSTVV